MSVLLPVLALSALLSSCGNKPNGSPGQDGNAPANVPVIGQGRIQAVRFIDPVQAIVSEPPISARGAKNETVHFALQINSVREGRGRPLLRLAPLAVEGGSIPVSNVAAYQVVPMPVDTNHAAFVRYTGLPATAQRLPRALLPLRVSPAGEVDLSQLRDPDNAAAPPAPRGQPISPIIWIDVQVPPAVPAGTYAAAYALVEDGDITANAAVSVQVDDFIIPDERHLLMVGNIDWRELTRLWPDRFKGIPPRLLSRKDERCAPAIRTLDDLVSLAEAHRCQAVVPELQPTAYWSAGKPPRVDWSDFDSVVTPWLDGSAFADRLPMGYWPMPAVERLYDLHTSNDQRAYWAEAAAHFDQSEWIARSSLEVPRRGQGRPTLDEANDISTQAARWLEVHPRIRVTVPLEEEQVRLATPEHLKWIQPAALDRVLYAGSGLVSATPTSRLPEGVGTRWLRTDLPGLIPYVGMGADEREARMWAWLAVVRDARLIRWPGVLPRESSASMPAAADELIWFYPGEWFGLDKPVPTVQLKWLRRAEQDFEYLWIARQRGQLARAQTLARLITRPVDLQGAQLPDPVYGLMSGASDPSAWAEALDLLARAIALAPPGQSVDREAQRKLDYAMALWARSQQRPLLMGRSLDWGLAPGAAPMLELSLGLDIYNIAAQPPNPNRVEWGGLPEGWSAVDRPTVVPPLAPFSVTRAPLVARVDLQKIKPGSSRPLRLTFVDGFTQAFYSIEVMAPVAYSEQRNGAPPVIDGNLERDWYQEDLLYTGPLASMLSRPAFQKQALETTQTSAAVYSTWTPANLYLGFKVEGADAPVSNAERSWVDYELRRAWGEDVCEMLIQPIYGNNLPGPLFHMAVKPRSQLEVERRLNPRAAADPWQPFNGGGIQYAANVSGATWRGEVVIPWSALSAPGDERRPRLLRFNFIQHRGSTGQSASWAGPIDQSRDDQLMGVVEIR